MNTSHEPTWSCLECGLDNPSANFICADCQTEKPRECDMCDEDFTPWRDTPKSRLEKWTCRRCYFQDAGHPSDNIDRDEGEDR